MHHKQKQDLMHRGPLCYAIAKHHESDGMSHIFGRWRPYAASQCSYSICLGPILNILNLHTSIFWKTKHCTIEFILYHIPSDSIYSLTLSDMGMKVHNGRLTHCRGLISPGSCLIGLKYLNFYFQFHYILEISWSKLFRFME